MSKRVELFVVPGMRENEEALKALRDLPDTEVKVIRCPPGLEEWYTCPYIWTDSKLDYAGLDGIRSFVEREIASASGNGSRAEH